MIVEINDMTTPMLSVIRQVSKDVAYEQMSKIGTAIRKNAGNRMRSTRNRHHWLQKPDKDGVLQPYFSKTKTKEFGQRTKSDGKTTDNPDSMSNMITSNLMELSGTLIVGGRNKRKKVIYRKDGKITGSGTLPTITKHTQSIIHKLDTGERNKDHRWLNGQGKYFEKMNFKGRHFMVKAFGDSMPYMRQQLTTEYERVIGRVANKVKVRLKPSKKVVA